MTRRSNTPDCADEVVFPTTPHGRGIRPALFQRFTSSGSSTSSFASDDTPPRRRAATAPQMYVSDLRTQQPERVFTVGIERSSIPAPSDSNAAAVVKKSKSHHVSTVGMAAGIASLLNLVVSGASSATLLGISASTAGKLAFVITAFQAVPFAGQITLAVRCGVLAILAGVYFVRSLSKSTQGAGIFPRKSPVLTMQTRDDLIEGSRGPALAPR